MFGIYCKILCESPQVTLRTFNKHLGDISVGLILSELEAHSSHIKMSG